MIEQTINVKPIDIGIARCGFFVSSPDIRIKIFFYRTKTII